ncbi:MAG: YmfQ family protein [Alphaproteobacteria bacterium]
MIAEEYGQALKALLPPGAAWPRHEGSNLAALMEALGEELARVDARGRVLLKEIDPRAASELIGEWESALGLPDPCTDPPETLAEQRTAAYRKYAVPGGQTIAYFLSIAGETGYTDVTIEEFRPFVCGLSECGVDSLDGDESVRHSWRVTVPDASVSFARAGAARAGDFLADIDQAEDLECVLRDLKPAHTNLIFNYEGN